MTDPDPGQLRGIKVLVLFGGSHLFGQERANIEVMRTIREVGAKVRFITDKRHAGGEVERALGRLAFSFARARFTVHWHYALRRPRYLLSNIFALASTAWHLVREARRWQPTHLYVMNWNFFASAFLGFRVLRLPLIFRAGDTLPDHSPFHDWLTRQLLRRTQVMVCNSEFLARDMARLGISPERVRVIHNHPPRREPPDPGEQLPKTFGGVTLLFIGQIARHKGVAVLVEAVRRLLGTGNQINLWLAGESTWGDPLQEQLQSEVRKEGLDERIIFLGKRHDIPALLQRCDIHVCPSIVDDPSPNVIVEAKQEGVPSVAFPVGGIPELLEHKKDGYLCRDATTEALIEGLNYFMQDAEARKAAGQFARESFDRDFGFPRFQRQWAEVFLNSLPAC